MARPHDRPAAVEAARQGRARQAPAQGAAGPIGKAPVTERPQNTRNRAWCANSAPAICPSSVAGSLLIPKRSVARLIGRAPTRSGSIASKRPSSPKRCTSVGPAGPGSATAAGGLVRQRRAILPASGFGYRLIIDAIGRLEELGLVDHDRRKPSATRQRNRPTATSHGYQSRFMASERLMALATLQPPLRWEDRAPRPLILRNASGHPALFRETAWTRAAARNVAV